MPSDICTRLGKRVRLLRLKRGWRQHDLAAHAEVSKTHISAIERGAREICLFTLERLAAALDVTPAELLK